MQKHQQLHNNQQRVQPILVKRKRLFLRQHKIKNKNKVLDNTCTKHVYFSISSQSEFQENI
jgi:hypothetical protein